MKMDSDDAKLEEHNFRFIKITIWKQMPKILDLKY